MCLPLLAQVRAVDGILAEVQLLEGEVVRVNAGLQPDVGVGDYVLLDRGLIMEVIEPDQVEEMKRLYAEINELWTGEGAVRA